MIALLAKTTYASFSRSIGDELVTVPETGAEAMVPIFRTSSEMGYRGASGDGERTRVVAGICRGRRKRRRAGVIPEQGMERSLRRWRTAPIGVARGIGVRIRLPLERAVRRAERKFDRPRRGQRKRDPAIVLLTAALSVPPWAANAR